MPKDLKETKGWIQYAKSYYESNLLDGDDLKDCGKAIVDAEEAFNVMIEAISSLLLKKDEEMREIVESKSRQIKGLKKQIADLLKDLKA